MQKIILFIDHSDYAFETPVKIGNLFINRFAIDEDASFEILEIFERIGGPQNGGMDQFNILTFDSSFQN